MTIPTRKLIVSALIVTRTNKDDKTEILNVLAKNKTKYGFPGGKLEQGESPLDAVIRETKEELGVVPSNVEYIKTSHALTPEGVDIEMHVFSGNVSQEAAPNSEIAAIYWLTYEQMSEKMDLLTPMTIEHVLPTLKEI